MWEHTSIQQLALQCSVERFSTFQLIGLVGLAGNFTVWLTGALWLAGEPISALCPLASYFLQELDQNGAKEKWIFK